MKIPRWYSRHWYVCRTYLMEHHVTYVISPSLTVYRREHNTKCKPAKWFLVSCVDRLKSAKLEMCRDFEAWLSGESLAEPCDAEKPCI